jgi:hypothetical protein
MAVMLPGAGLQAGGPGPAATQSSAGAPPGPGPTGLTGYRQLDFKLLDGFPFTPPVHQPVYLQAVAPRASSLGQIPATVRQFDGQPVAISGFMVPVQADHGFVTEFLLVDPKFYRSKNPRRLTQGITVRLTTGVKATMEAPVTCYGTLRVREQFAFGDLVSLYQMAGTTVADNSAAMLASTPATVNGHMRLDFDRLAGFPFPTADAVLGVDPATVTAHTEPAAARPGTPLSLADQIPAAINQLDGKKVSLTGFMRPTKTDRGLATEFLLVGPKFAADLAEFGPLTTPPVNVWVLVRMPAGAKPDEDQPVTCSGTLRVGPQFDGKGNFEGIYELDAETVRAAAGSR